LPNAKFAREDPRIAEAFVLTASPTNDKHTIAVGKRADGVQHSRWNHFVCLFLRKNFFPWLVFVLKVKLPDVVEAPAGSIYAAKEKRNVIRNRD
jgi:hypothetical protein